CGASCLVNRTLWPVDRSNRNGSSSPALSSAWRPSISPSDAPWTATAGVVTLQGPSVLQTSTSTSPALGMSVTPQNAAGEPELTVLTTSPRVAGSSASGSPTADTVTVGGL